MTYVVAGVTGKTGSVTARTLLAQGEKVRVIVREAEKGEAFEREGAEVTVADLSDSRALADALRGARGAYLLLPPAVQAEDVVANQARVAESIAQAVAEARLPHVVFLSSIAAHLPSGTGPIITVAQAEHRFAKVQRTVFTFLRPPYFMENFASSLGGLADGVFNTFIAPGRAFPMIASADVGKAAASQLRRGAKQNHVLQLAGPQDLSIEQVAAVFSQILDRRLALEVSPIDIMPDVLASVGQSRDMGRLYAEMITSLNLGAIVYDSSEPLERGTTQLAEVARQLLRPC